MGAGPVGAGDGHQEERSKRSCTFMYAVPETSPPVMLNLYNLGGLPGSCTLNKLLSPLDMGVFHCGVEVCGVEWSYGGERQRTHEWHPVFGESPIASGVYRYK